jgi:hypothetical protein
MQIAPTAFPGPLNDYRFFPATRRRVLIGWGRVVFPGRSQRTTRLAGLSRTAVPLINLH